jgi:hypothetical protein
MHCFDAEAGGDPISKKGFTLQDSYRINSYKICSYESNAYVGNIPIGISILYKFYANPLNQKRP